MFHKIGFYINKMDVCIFRDIRKKCTLCSNKPIHNSLYCNKHMHTKNTAFKHIMSVYKDKEIDIDALSIISIYREIYAKEEIETRRIILKSLLGNKNRIIDIVKTIGIKNPKKKLKKELIDMLFNHLEWFCMAISLKSTNRKVSSLGLLWRDYMARISGSIYGNPCNDHDIFTFNTIQEIENPFYILDNAKCYVFEPAYIYEFFKREGYWNPYNRNALNRSNFVRLNKFLYIKRIKKELFNDFEWNSPHQAFTDVVIEFERLGFYSQVEWFISLGYNIILKIIIKFHQYSLLISHNFFRNNDIDNVYPQYIYTFCRMIIELLSDITHPDHYTLTCLLYKSLIDCSKRFRENAPEWMTDITILPIM